MRTIRVLVVDDSAIARAMLKQFLESDAQIVVVGEAADGLEACALVAQERPDLVTMDLEMPVCGGLEAIGTIMARHPVPILVVSGRADAHAACRAVALGALDLIDKPDSSAHSREAFIARVKLLATIPVIRHLRPGHPVKPSPARSAPAPLGTPHARLCAIVASTGGPQMLARILGALPERFDCPILIAQHIGDGFIDGMADWLDSVCQLSVQVARDGHLPRPGSVYLAPPETNLALDDARRMRLLAHLPNEIYHPNGDVLLSSVARTYGRAGIGVILTGMGSDGAHGMAQLRHAGGVTLAQDEASSIIYGMNRSAIEHGAIGQVLAGDAIAAALRSLIGNVP